MERLKIASCKDIRIATRVSAIMLTAAAGAYIDLHQAEAQALYPCPVRYTARGIPENARLTVTLLNRQTDQILAQSEANNGQNIDFNAPSQDGKRYDHVRVRSNQSSKTLDVSGNCNTQRDLNFNTLRPAPAPIRPPIGVDPRRGMPERVIVQGDRNADWINIFMRKSEDFLWLPASIIGLGILYVLGRLVGRRILVEPAYPPYPPYYYETIPPRRSPRRPIRPAPSRGPESTSALVEGPRVRRRWYHPRSWFERTPEQLRRSFEEERSRREHAERELHAARERTTRAEQTQSRTEADLERTRPVQPAPAVPAQQTDTGETPRARVTITRPAVAPPTARVIPSRPARNAQDTDQQTGQL